VTYAGTTDTASGRCQGKAYPPAPGASGLDRLAARRSGRATLAPPQTLLRAHHARGRERTVCAWYTRHIARGQCQAFPERAVYSRASPNRRARPVGRMYTPEVYGGLSPGTPGHFLPLSQRAV